MIYGGFQLFVAALNHDHYAVSLGRVLRKCPMLLLMRQKSLNILVSASAVANVTANPLGRATPLNGASRTSLLKNDKIVEFLV